MRASIEDFMSFDLDGILSNFTNTNFNYALPLLPLCLLSSCGDDSGSSTDPINTPTPYVTESINPHMTFTKVENAFSGLGPFNGKGSNNKPVIFDINNDGYKDILFWWMNGAPVLGANYAGKPTTAQIQLLVNDSGRGFVDQTLRYFPNPNVDGGTDSFVVQDFNNDGITDIVFATSREDGRNTDDPKDAATQLNAFISNAQTGTFDNVKFGQSAWYSYIGKFDINGKTYLSAVGSHGDSDDPAQEVFTFENGKFVLTKGILPEKSASDFGRPFALGANYIFYDDDGDRNADTLYNTNGRTHLVVNGVETDNYTFGIDAYKYSVVDNRWTHVGSYFPMNEKHFVKNVEFVSWNYNINTQPIYEFAPSTYSVRDDAYVSSTNIKLSPGGSNCYAALVLSTIFKADDIANVSRISEGDLVTRASVAFFNITDGKLQKVDVSVKGLDNLELVGQHYIENVDYNRDGYDDLVIYTWNKTNFPLVFLNDHNNSFYKIDEVVDNKDYLSGSFFADFNSDGLLDIFSYISDGSFDIKAPDMSQFNLYFGTGFAKVAEADVNNDLFSAKRYDMTESNSYVDPNFVDTTESVDNFALNLFTDTNDWVAGMTYDIPQFDPYFSLNSFMFV